LTSEMQAHHVGKSLRAEQFLKKAIAITDKKVYNIPTIEKTGACIQAERKV